MTNRPPVIEPVPEGAPRPFWSVMIPAFQAGDFLKDTLRSVLEQDPGAERMQIEVVDDSSSERNVKSLVEAAGGTRVGFHRNERNLGLAGNWNECIRRARGEVVHLLHQDDLVSPGFYERLEKGLERAGEAGAAFCRYGFADPNGARTWEAPREREEPGLLEDWLDVISVKCRIQCAAIVVRRSIYEQLGGYHPDLLYALDWEMWVRIAAHAAFWYLAAIMAPM